MALDLDTSPVIGAVRLIPLLSKWRRLEIRNTATWTESEEGRDEVQRARGGYARQFRMSERGGEDDVRR